MTLVIALLILATYPLFYSLLKQNAGYRAWAFMAIGAVPLLNKLPVSGFLYGWGVWPGTVHGFAISLIDTLALALIVTRRRVIGPTPFRALMALYGAVLIFSVFMAPVRIGSAFACWQFARMALMLVAIAGETQTPALRNSLMGGMAIGVIYQAGYVISQRLGGAIQASGTMAHQNILGLAVELSLPPLLAALLAGSRSKLVMAGCAASMICIAGSGSRATVGIVLPAALLLMVISVIRRPKPHKWKMVAGAGLALMIALPVAVGTLNARFKGGSFITAEEERKAFESAALAMAADHPFGVGANQYVFASNVGGYADRAKIPWQAGDRSVPVHNAYLLARAETGLVGEGLFILLLVIPAAAAIRFTFANRRDPGGEVTLGSAVAIVAIIFHNRYEFAVHTFDVEALLFMNIGLIAAQIRERKAAGRKRRVPKRKYADVALRGKIPQLQQ